MINSELRTIDASAKISPYVVFVSHSSADIWIAGVMAEKISAVGADPWLDKIDLEGGDVIPKKIMKGINACKEAVVLVSPASVGSQWVLVEIGAVWGQHKRVTPILNGVKYDAIELLKDVKSIELNDLNVFLKQLKKRVERYRSKRIGG